ncbi:autotransporter [Andreprevotia chitinilytica]|uniref:autotransporter n=1 Tax=Andreprevotia chitinilytica TaxID=396808 RepID=UPI000550BD35|nr:autotransporter [Andreprevotia chitinilytica]
MPHPLRPNRKLAAMLALAFALHGCGGGGGSSSGAATATAASTARTDITAAVLANQNITLNGDSIINLPAGATTYTGVITGQGTLLINPAGGTASPGTLIVTQSSNVTLPDAQQVATSSLSHQPHFVVEMVGEDPPVITINPGATLQLGTNTSADNSPLFFAYSNSKNAANVINGQVNLDNILNNGTLALNTGYNMRLGQISGSGNVVQRSGAWGLPFMERDNPFTGVLVINTQGNFGISHIAASLPNAKAVLNEGSWIVSAAPDHTTLIKPNIYEAHYGDDINYGGTGTVIMQGVYSYTDNSPHGSPNLVNPGLSDPSLNMSVVVNKGGSPNQANGHDSSYRGINIESGTAQWGDGTTSAFFLPSAPSPAEVNPALGSKNAYINLHNNSTLAIDYNGPVTLNIGITGGGGGPDKSGLPGTGNVNIVAQAGNDVTFAQPQNYNGTTTIGAGAILRLGSGKSVPLNTVTFDSSGNKSTVLTATYSGDSSLLTAESTGGLSTDAIVDNGQLIIQNTATNITLSNISGSGSLTQAGSVTTTLAGSNSYSGGTSIGSGTLNIASNAALGSGSVKNAATLATASGQHVITVGGTFSQTSSGTLVLNIGGVNQGVDYDVLKVTGLATLQGTLQLHFTGSFAAGQKFQLISASGGLSGDFASINGNGVTVVASRDSTGYYVTVQ